jgi:surfactin synthase thioesterase subunit/acyl carrier protein
MPAPAAPVSPQSGARAKAAVHSVLQREIMAELGFEEPLDPDRPLNELGLDSLRAVKLSITLEQEFGIPISVPELIRGPTINEFADHLDEALAAVGRDGNTATRDEMTSTPDFNSVSAHAVVQHNEPEPPLRASTSSARIAANGTGPSIRASAGTNSGVHSRDRNAEPFERARSHANGGAAPGCAGRWLIAPRPNPSAKARLFCFPYAGGGVGSFRGWARSLSDDIELVAVEAPGRGTRINETAVGDLDTFVRQMMPELLEWLDRPSAFFGHCLGGLTMFATLRVLPPQCAHLVRHAFACGVRPPHLLRRRGPFEDNLAYGVMLHHEYDVSVPPYAQPDEVFAYIVRQFETPDADRMLAIPKLRNVLLPAIRAEFGMAYNYHYRPGEPFSFPITSFVGDADPWVSHQDSAGWGALTRGAFTNHLRKGSHFLMMDDQTYILQTIEKELAGPSAH